MTTTYESYSATMNTARNREAGKPLQNNTRLFDRGEGVLAVRLHNTDVVTLHPDGRVTLNSGGWQTLTTKDRMNAHAPIRLSQTDKEWFVSHDRARSRADRQAREEFGIPLDLTPAGDHFFGGPRHWERDDAPRPGTPEWKAAAKRSREFHRRVAELSEVPYFDGITFDADGNVLNGASPDEWRAYRELRKERRRQLSKFCGLVKRSLSTPGKLSMPGPGDCWGCLMLDDDGREAMGDDHHVSHMEEGYVVPSMLVNALRAAGYSDTGVYMLLGMDPETNSLGNRAASPDRVADAVRSYLYRKVVPSPPTGE